MMTVVSSRTSSNGCQGLRVYAIVLQQTAVIPGPSDLNHRSIGPCPSLRPRSLLLTLILPTPNLNNLQTGPYRLIYLNIALIKLVLPTVLPISLLP